MIKTLTAIPRRTPLLAIILAPVALYLLVLLWEQAFVPLWRSVWYSDTVLQWRVDGDRPETRIVAIKDIASRRGDDEVLLDALVARLQADESKGVRMAAAAALGRLGSHRPLTAEAIEALSTQALGEQDDGMFMLYFMAGHAGNLKASETAILAAVLWGAIAVYAALGWGMHYAVRR